MDIKNKIPIHIGLFGHIDSGKTAIAAVLSEVISTAGIDGHPQSKERGITIDLGFTSFILDQYLITLVDGPGHADLIRISASSVEIIDIAMVVIDINKGPQVQTGEHLIMIEALKIKKIIVVLNKIDLFQKDLKAEISRTREFFKTTPFGSDVPLFAVSAKQKEGFEDLQMGMLETIKSIDIQRDYEGSLIIPIDHHFPIKGRGAILTGTILKGTVKLNENLEILPLKITGKVKSIQIFRQNVDMAKAGDRVGINIKNVDVKRIFRGCIATNNPNMFDFCDILEILVEKNKFFKHETHFGSQVHATSGMLTVPANIYPFYALNEKKIQTTVKDTDLLFKAILWLNEKIMIFRENTVILISRFDLPPTTLRILGSAHIKNIYIEPPLIYKYKIKKGRIEKDLICTGLAQSTAGAKKIIGRELEPPFTTILDTFGTKGAVIVGLENKNLKIKKGEPVILKELRSFRLKKI